MAGNSLIGFDVKGIPELNKALQLLPPQVRDVVADDVLKYMLKIEQEQPSKKSVSRKEAYPGASFQTSTGKTVIGYVSQKQFNFVMSLVAGGKVPYSRTQGLRNSWQIVGKGVESILVSDASGAEFVKGDQTQANQLKLVGWKTIGTDVKERMGRILEIANAAANKAIKKLGLG